MFEENATPNQPTMPQILASVRRIISREEDAIRAPAAAVTPTPQCDEEFAVAGATTAAAPIAEPEAVATEAAAPSATQSAIPEDDDEFLRINTFLQSYPQQDLNPQFANALKDTVQNVGTHVQDTLQNAVQSVLPTAVAPFVEDAMVLTKQVLNDGTVHDHAPEITPAEAPTSIPAAAVATTAPVETPVFTTFTPRDTSSLSQNDSFLELLVLRALQPMLREWIDTKLPPLAEQLLREQLRRQ